MLGKVVTSLQLLNRIRRTKNKLRSGAVVDLLFNVLVIVCGIYVFVFVLSCITLCPF